jgi:hypothetical protein
MSSYSFVKEGANLMENARMLECRNAGMFECLNESLGDWVIGLLSY